MSECVCRSRKLEGGGGGCSGVMILLRRGQSALPPYIIAIIC